MISSFEGILFECPRVSKVITISEDMLPDGDGCIEYECMKLKRDNDVGKLFFIFSKFSSKGPIELNATFG
ncbi:hypothetical protein GmHk_14G041454 [Glycine max]|nr:hypothetical protein GmHk_14G041454 [Glycine max]